MQSKPCTKATSAEAPVFPPRRRAEAPRPTPPFEIEAAQSSADRRFPSSSSGAWTHSVVGSASRPSATD